MITFFRRLEKSPNTTGAGCGKVKMCHGEIRYGFFFLVESDITIFLPSTIGIFLFSAYLIKLKKLNLPIFRFL